MLFCYIYSQVPLHSCWFGAAAVELLATHIQCKWVYSLAQDVHIQDTVPSEEKATSQHVKDPNEIIKIIMRFSIFSWLEYTSAVKSLET